MKTIKSSFDLDVFELIDELCRNNNCSRSEFVRIVVMDFLKSDEPKLSFSKNGEIENSKRITFRCGKDIYHLIKDKAFLSGISISQEANQRISHTLITEPVLNTNELEQVRILLVETKKIGMNINTIAKHLNQGKILKDVDVLKHSIDDLKNTFIKIENSLMELRTSTIDRYRYNK